MEKNYKEMRKNGRNNNNINEPVNSRRITIRILKIHQIINLKSMFSINLSSTINTQAKSREAILYFCEVQRPI